jgi:hypothetical protein
MQSNASRSGEHPADSGGVQRGRHAQRPREGLAPLGQVQAGQVPVQVGPAPGLPAGRVGDQDALDGDHPQQIGGLSAPPAPDAGAGRGAQTGLSASGAVAGSRVTSGRMSIRQPVSRAASRAFCPSFPIASDSW